MKLPRIDFVISNGGHHLENFDPVVRSLRSVLNGRYSFGFVSLCELRGLSTPEKLPLTKLDSVTRLFPAGVRRSSSVGSQGGAGSRLARGVFRLLLSRLYLRRRIADWLTDPPCLVVLPNDSAFPYDILCSILRHRSIPFILVQEGIRFPLPTDTRSNPYGRGGAIRVAAWGEASRDYFRTVGTDEESLRLAGCPRFDQIAERDWESLAAELRDRLGVEGRILTLLTNPIDDQGYCSTAEKIDLVATVVEVIGPVLKSEGCTLVLKPHARESPAAYESAISRLGVRNRTKVVPQAPLYPLLAASSGAITMASTAGLEALLFNLPLGVVKIPGAGFVHDYVSSGAAWGLDLNGTSAAQVREMLHEGDQNRSARDVYLNRQIYRRTGSAQIVANIIAEVLGEYETP